MHDRAQRRFRWGLALLVLGIGAFGSAVATAIYAPETGVGLLSYAPVTLGIGSLLVGTLQFLAGSRDQQASPGDRPVLAGLRARAGDEYTYLCHVSIPGHRADAHGLLVGPHGVLVITVMYARGLFAVQEHEWRVTANDGSGRLSDRSPTWELMRPLRAMQRVVEELGLGQIKVQGAVVLVGGELVTAERPAAAIVPVARLPEYVEYLRPETPINAQITDALVEALAPFAGGNRRPR